jgi:hypothetical protein
MKSRCQKSRLNSPSVIDCSRLQADRFLLRDGATDRFVLDRAQIGILRFARSRERGRAQQAADVVGVKGRDRGHVPILQVSAPADQ